MGLHEAWRMRRTKACKNLEVWGHGTTGRAKVNSLMSDKTWPRQGQCLM